MKFFLPVQDTKIAEESYQGGVCRSLNPALTTALFWKMRSFCAVLKPTFDRVAAFLFSQ
jgi:hypothetical protein